MIFSSKYKIYKKYKHLNMIIDSFLVRIKKLKSENKNEPDKNC